MPDKKTPRNPAKEIIDKLAEKAFMDKCCSSMTPPKLGQMIESLGPVQRQLLKDLKSEDIEDIRWPRI